MFFFMSEIFEPHIDIRKALSKAKGEEHWELQGEYNALMATLPFRLMADEQGTIRIFREDGVFEDGEISDNIKESLALALHRSGKEISHGFLFEQFKKNRDLMLSMAWTLPESGAYGGLFEKDLREMLADPAVKENREYWKTVDEESEYPDEEITFPAPARSGGGEGAGGTGGDEPGEPEEVEDRGTPEGLGVGPLILCLAAAGLLAAVAVLVFLAVRSRRRKIGVKS